MTTTTRAAPGISREHRIRNWLRLRWVPVSLTVVALVITWVTIFGHTRAMSPIDEWVYLDYLYKLPTQFMVHKGELMSQWSLQIMACDGQVLQGIISGLTCQAPFNPQQFPYTGITSADAYTPLFFLPTSLIGWGLHFVTGLDPVITFRLATTLWLVAGVLMLLAVLRLFSVPNIIQFMVGLLVIGAPFSYWTYTYVSTDASALVFTAMLLYFTIRYIRGELRPWPIVLVSVLATAAKVTNILAVLLIALILCCEWIIRTNDEHPGWRATWRNLWRRDNLKFPLWAAIATLSSLVFEYAWLKLDSLLAVSSQTAEQGIGAPLNVLELLRLSMNFALGILQIRLPIGDPGGIDGVPIPTVAVVPLGWLTVAAVVGGFWTLTKKSSHRSLIIATALGTVTFGPLLAILVKFTQGHYFQLTPRYAAFMVVAILVIAALQIKNKWAVWILIVYGACICLAQPVMSFAVTTFLPG